MAISIGYGPPQTDLPGAIATGLRLGMRGKQILSDEEERKRRAEQFASALALRKKEFGLAQGRQEFEQEVKWPAEFGLAEGKEEREEEKWNWEREVEFPEALKSKQDALAASVKTNTLRAKELAAKIDYQEGEQSRKLLELANEAGPVAEQAFMDYANIDKDPKTKRIPGKAVYLKQKAAGQAQGFIQNMISSVSSLVEQSDEASSGLKSQFQQSLMNIEAARREQADIAELEADQEVFDNFLDAVKELPVTGEALPEHIQGYLDSPNPVFQAVGEEMKTKITPRTIDAASMMDKPENYIITQSYMNASPDEQGDIADLMFLKKFGRDEKPSAWDLQMMAQSTVKSLRESLMGEPELINVDADVIAMRTALGDPTALPSADNFYKYYKENWPSMSNQARIKAMFPSREQVVGKKEPFVGSPEEKVKEKKEETKESEKKEGKIEVSKELFDDLTAGVKAVNEGRDVQGVLEILLKEYTDPNEMKTIKDVLGVK